MSLIGAVVLYVLAIGSVRGFAFFLGLSTILDLLVAYFFMHPLVSFLARAAAARARCQEGRHRRGPRRAGGDHVTTATAPAPRAARGTRSPDLYHERTNFQFIDRTWRWAILSGIAHPHLGRRVRRCSGLNLGIDFEGGTPWQVTVATARSASVADVRDALDAARRRRRQGRSIVGQQRASGSQAKDLSRRRAGEGHRRAGEVRRASSRAGRASTERRAHLG